jgi:hypothetical protein
MCFASFKAFVTRNNENTQTIHQHTKQKSDTNFFNKKYKKRQTTMQKEKQKIMI